MAKTVLLLGNYRPSLAVLRALGRRRWRTLLGRDGDVSQADRSRFVDAVWDHPSIVDDPNGFEAALTRLVEARADIGAVFPISERANTALAGLRRPLPVPVWAPRPETVLACVDKATLTRLAHRTGLSLARHALFHAAADLPDVAARVGFPCVLKPGGAAALVAGRKAIPVNGAPDAEAVTRAIAGEAGPWIVQRRVFGKRHNLYFAAERGALLAGAEVRIDRTDRADGSGHAVDGRTIDPTPAIWAQTRDLLAELSYTGIGCAQFLREADAGALSFLEINPRIGANAAVVHRAGLDLAAWAERLADESGVPAPAAADDYARGVRYAWTKGDLSGLKNALGERSIGARAALGWSGRLLASALLADMHLTWDWRDPVPTLALYAQAVAPGLRARARPAYA